MEELLFNVYSLGGTILPQLQLLTLQMIWVFANSDGKKTKNRLK